MTREDMEEIVEQLAQLGLKPVLIVGDEEPEEPEKPEELEEIKKDMLRSIRINKHDFNEACDTVVYNWDSIGVGSLGFKEVIMLSRFTAAVRAVLFDKDKKTEKEEN